MAEYIDRDELLLRIDCHGTNKFGVLDEDIRVFVKTQPAANVVPVVHGRWDVVEGRIENAVCSNCGRHFQSYYEAYRYCPNCGAKMNGDSYGERQERAK